MKLQNYYPQNKWKQEKIYNQTMNISKKSKIFSKYSMNIVYKYNNDACRFCYRQTGNPIKENWNHIFCCPRFKEEKLFFMKQIISLLNSYSYSKFTNYTINNFSWWFDIDELQIIQTSVLLGPNLTSWNKSLGNMGLIPKLFVTFLESHNFFNSQVLKRKLQLKLIFLCTKSGNYVVILKKKFSNQK
jgi:hypothetical protein